ncbi:MAG: hypothetical protein EP343_34520 [Deltaproteobacteria bacterium]|nr:MAG: hypothetical protein EP343_34520 [Deltaproteobacteria bacterium]
MTQDATLTATITSPESGRSWTAWLVVSVLASAALAFASYHYVTLESLSSQLQKMPSPSGFKLTLFLVGHAAVAWFYLLFFVYSFHVVRSYRSSRTWLSQGFLTVGLYLWLSAAWVGLGFPVGPVELVAISCMVLLVVLAVGFRTRFVLAALPHKLSPYELATHRGVLFLFYGAGVALLSYGAAFLWYLVPFLCLAGGFLFFGVYLPWRRSRPSVLVYIGLVVVTVGPLVLTPYSFVSVDRLAKGERATLAQGVALDPRLSRKEKLLLLDPSRYNRAAREEVAAVILKMWESEPSTFVMPFHVLFAMGDVAKEKEFPMVSFFRGKPKRRRMFLHWLFRVHVDKKPVGFGSDLFCPVYHAFPKEQAFLKEQLVQLYVTALLPKSHLHYQKEPPLDVVTSQVWDTFRTQKVGESGVHSSLRVALERCFGKDYENQVLHDTLGQYKTASATTQHLYWLHWVNQLLVLYHFNLPQQTRPLLEQRLRTMLQGNNVLEKGKGAFFVLQLCRNPAKGMYQAQLCKNVLSTVTKASLQSLLSSNKPMLQSMGLQLELLTSKTTQSKAAVVQKLVKLSQGHGPIPLLVLLERWGGEVWNTLSPEASHQLGVVLARHIAKQKEISSETATRIQALVSRQKAKNKNNPLLDALLELLQRQPQSDAFWTLHALSVFQERAALALPVLAQWIQKKKTLGYTLSGRIRIFLLSLKKAGAPLLPALEGLMTTPGNPYFFQLGYPTQKAQLRSNLKLLKSLGAKTDALERALIQLAKQDLDGDVRAKVKALLALYQGSFPSLSKAQANAQMKQLQQQLNVAIARHRRMHK